LKKEINFATRLRKMSRCVHWPWVVSPQRDEAGVVAKIPIYSLDKGADDDDDDNDVEE